MDDRLGQFGKDVRYETVSDIDLNARIQWISIVGKKEFGKLPGKICEGNEEQDLGLKFGIRARVDPKKPLSALKSFSKLY